MLGDLTLNNIATDIGLIMAIAVGFGTLYVKLKAGLSKVVADQLKPLMDQIASVDLETTKNFIVRCIADIERGEVMAETEKERFYEQYEHYIKKGGNTYIKAKVERLQAEGRL